MAVHSSLWNSLIKGQIWPQYSQISKITTNYTEEKMLWRQVKELKKVETSSSKQFKNATLFINEAQQNLKTLDDEIIDKSQNQIYGRIIELLNLGLWGNEENPTKKLSQNLISTEQRDKEVNKAIEELKYLLQLIKINQPLSEKIIKDFENRIKKQSGKNEIYTQIKADYSEKIAADILSKNPGWKVLQTGKFADKIGQSILEDIMAFSQGSLKKQFKEGALEYSIKTKDGIKTTSTVQSLDQLFKEIEKLNDNQTIQLSDPLYEVLQKASQLSTQVKSGRNNQPILSRAERNRISLNGENGIGFFKEYKILKNIYYDKSIPWKPIEEQNSKELAIISNYQLSKEIAKTALTTNALYFTEKGFISASEWLETNKYILKFANPVNQVGDDFETALRRYKLSKINS